MVATMGLMATMVLCWRSGQGMGVMPSSSSSTSSTSMSLIRTSLLLPASLHVSVCLKGVIVVVWWVVRGVASCAVVLPLGLTKQLLLRTIQARKDRERERGEESGEGLCLVERVGDIFVDIYILCGVLKIWWRFCGGERGR